MHSIRRIDKELFDGAGKDTKKLSIPATEFIRKAILEKVENINKFEKY